MNAFGVANESAVDGTFAEHVLRFLASADLLDALIHQEIQIPEPRVPGDGAIPELPEVLDMPDLLDLT